MKGRKQELWIKNAVAKENCELVYNKIFCANAKTVTYFAEVFMMMSTQL
jgi:hypothetical protein